MIKINGGEKPTTESVWSRLLRYIEHWQALGYGYWAVFEKTTGRMLVRLVSRMFIVISHLS